MAAPIESPYTPGELITEGELAGWTKGSFNAVEYTRATFRRSPPATTTATPSATAVGGGAAAAPARAPCIIIIHEIPGIHPRVIQFANEVVAAGYEVIMPSLLGVPGKAVNPWYMARTLYTLCISKEFTVWALNETSPIIDYLRAMAQYMHGECGGHGVGVVGMCFSGGFALGMMVDGHVAAPVLSQPSLPFALTRARRADLNLSVKDLEDLGEYIESESKKGRHCEVRGYMYKRDCMVGTRFETLERVLGTNFIGVRYEGCKHSVLTTDRVGEAVADVLAFFRQRLTGNVGGGDGHDGDAQEEG